MRAAGVLAIVLGTGVARAAPATEYERSYRRGTELSERHEWARARAEFEAAYQIEPRAILLFNIASTYLHENDRLNARVYYQWYLDKGGDDPKLIAIARDRLAELDRPAPQVAAVVPAEPAYPRAAIERPLVLPIGMIAAATGITVAPLGEVASTTAGDGTGYAYRGVVGGMFGLASRVSVAGELDLDLADAHASLAFAQATLGLSEGRLAVALRGTLGLAFARTGLYDVRFAVPLRYRLTDQLALVSSDDSLLVTLDDTRKVIVRVPVGLAYQLPASVYATVETRLAALELRAPSTRVLFADYRLVALGVTVVPAAGFDVVARVTAATDGNAAVALLRLRM